MYAILDRPQVRLCCCSSPASLVAFRTITPEGWSFEFLFPGCSLEEALEAAALHPAQLLGISHRKGKLDYGSDAGQDPAPLFRKPISRNEAVFAVASTPAASPVAFRLS